MIRLATVDDAAAVCAIYNPYVVETTITFEEVPVSAEEMAQRLRAVLADYPWLVWDEGGQVKGYAYASKWRVRSAYRYSAESTVYVDKQARARGIGRRLYDELLQRMSAQGMHRIVAGIALPNDASVSLHERLGFVPCGRFQEIGFKLGRWVDVGYWQLSL